MNRKILITVALAMMLAIAGCAGTTTDSGNEEAKKAEEDIGNSAGEDVSGVQPGPSYNYEIKITEKNQQHLVKSQPPFTMDSSLERENLIKRYQYLNDRNNVHHVYLMDEGQVVAYYVAQGKVSSVNSKLTNDKQIVHVQGCEYKDDLDGAAGSNGACYKAVESPQMDGSYGTNGDGIFFFTTDGKYVETSLDYVVSEEPMNIQDEVILVDEVDDEKNDDTNSTDE